MAKADFRSLQKPKRQQLITYENFVSFVYISISFPDINIRLDIAYH